MPSKLFSTTDRAAAHAELDRIIARGKHPRAECREDANSEEPYSVWDGPEEKVARTETVEEVLSGLPEDAIERIARRVADLLKGG